MRNEVLLPLAALIALGPTVAGCASSRPTSIESRGSGPPPGIGESTNAPSETPTSGSVSIPTTIEDPPSTSPTTLSELEALALARHGDLTRLDLERRAYEARAAGERAWPDPRLIYREYLVEVETRVGPQERAFGIEQPIPWPGLLGDRAQRELRHADRAGVELIGRRRQVLSQVRELWGEYHYLGRSIEIRRETLALLGRFERIAEDRLAVGQGGASPVIRVQVEIARLENDIATLEERARPLRSALLAQIGIGEETAIPFPERLEPRPVDPSDPDAIRGRLLGRDATLAGARAAVQIAESELELARYEGLPRLGVGVQTIFTGNADAPGIDGSGDDPWIVGLELELPLDRRRARSAKRAARDRRDAAVSHVRQLLRDREASLEDALFRREDGARRVSLYEESLLPKADEALRATESAFTAGESDTTDLLDAERVLLEFRLALARARTDRWLGEIRLRAFLGEPGEAPIESVSWPQEDR